MKLKLFSKTNRYNHLFFGVLFALGILILVVFIGTVSSFILPRNFVIKIPFSLESNYSIVRQVKIYDFCEPLPCHNVYVALITDTILEKRVTYCESSSTAGNIHLTVENAEPLAGLGTQDQRYCYEKSKIKNCDKGNTLVKLAIFSMLPIPQKIPNFYYCSS